MSIGALIKARIKALGLTQSSVCERSGLSTGFLSDVINGKKRLGAEGARRLAPVLNMSVTELLEETPETPDIETWFWPTKFATMSAEDLAQLQKNSPEERIAWVLNELQSAYPGINLAEKCNIPHEQLHRLMRGEGFVTPEALDRLTSTLKLPPMFLVSGEPGPNTQLARKVLSHHNATAWLAVVSYAMESDVPPEAISEMIRTFLRLAQNNSPRE